MFCSHFWGFSSVITSVISVILANDKVDEISNLLWSIRAITFHFLESSAF